MALVLGAGNQTPVACMDILHKLLMDDAVVVCKMNPVNEYLGPFIRCAPRPWLHLSLNKGHAHNNPARIMLVRGPVLGSDNGLPVI